MYIYYINQICVIKGLFPVQDNASFTDLPEL
ncbi:hypothetical protein VIBNIMADA3021_510029 [Vibrio nigripulchritudo MADA3021]|nr:hypothetical protein VIBNIMADA3021_510029 [Vibrio nigripulchritudo MADA3021]